MFHKWSVLFVIVMLVRRSVVKCFQPKSFKSCILVQTDFQFRRWLSTGSVNDASKGKGKASIAPSVTIGFEELRQARLSKLNLIQKSDALPYAYSFPQTHKAAELLSTYVDLPVGEELPNTSVSVAGRIMMKRVFGKLAFFQLQDESGFIQLYIEKGRLLEAFNGIKDFTDAGDIIGVTGTVKRTDKGELSVYVKEWKMLSKSILPLPDKYHGLVDINKRYRQRHVDMIVNPEVRQVFRSRAFIISSFRRLLDASGYIEVETPVLESQPGGAEAKPFNTYHNALDLNLTLRIATELHLKRMIVGGFERVYELGRIFRNEGLSTRHNPEFTTIEMYQAYSDYHDMMKFTEDSITQIAQDLHHSKVFTYQGTSIDLSTPWKRISMNDIVKEQCGIDLYPFIKIGDVQSAREAVLSLGGIATAFIDKCLTAGELLNLVFEEKCEATLIQPTFITDHPIDISPLAKPHRSLPGLTERFELFIVGREHANGYSELTDPIDQRKRFEAQAVKKAAGNDEVCDVDEEFLHALEIGMPPTAGLGIGIDRVVMLLTDSASIKDVIAFPLLKPEPKDGVVANQI